MSEIELRIRANTLEVNDWFIKQGSKYRVIKIEDGKIYFNQPKNSAISYLGVNSMEWVMWVGKWEPFKRPPKKEKPPPKRPKIPIIAKTKDGSLLGNYNSIKQASLHLGLSYKYIERYIKKELVKEKPPFYRFEKA